jgi:hypothetical protein
MSSCGSGKLVISVCQSPFVAAFVSSLSLPLLLLILIFAKWVIENRTHKLMTMGTNSSEQVSTHIQYVHLSQCLSPKSPAGKLISTSIYYLLPCQRLHNLHTSREMELETAGLCNKNSTRYKWPLHCLPEECRKFRFGI